MNTDFNTLISEFQDLSNERESPPDESQPFYINEKELAIILKVDRSSLYRIRQRGMIPYKREGKNVLYDYEDLIHCTRVGFFKFDSLTKVQILDRLNTYYKLCFL